jgi:hypothetical protein
MLKKEFMKVKQQNKKNKCERFFFFHELFCNPNIHFDFFWIHDNIFFLFLFFLRAHEKYQKNLSKKMFLEREVILCLMFLTSNNFFISINT